MKINIVIVALLMVGALCMRAADRVPGPPGMKDTVVYSGYLDTYQNDRKLHYVFVQSDQKPQQAPLTIWLNGGPGCSSLIGYMQQIGPYLVGNTYKMGDQLIKNQYRWNKASNILFIESPGIVGFSSDKNPQIVYNDRQTADDCFIAIKDFLEKVAPQFSNRQLFIAGQSYAGKYIPDLTVRILDHNRQANVTYINLKGILVGNGVMSHDISLVKNKIQYMIQHDFISQRLLQVYRAACTLDFFSPRCQYFKYQYQILRNFINPYYIYEVCWKTGKSIEQIRTQEFINRIQKKLKDMEDVQRYGKNPQKNYEEPIELKQINSCPSDAGMIDYLNLYKATYNVFSVNKTWSPCTDLKYEDTKTGSMEQYEQIFLNPAIKVWLYNGDWDNVIPYTDTIQNLKVLKRRKAGTMQPWFIGQKHAGFYQLYDSLNFITIKGAGHEVPRFKPAASYQMFYNFIKNRPINTPV